MKKRILTTSVFGVFLPTILVPFLSIANFQNTLPRNTKDKNISITQQISSNFLDSYLLEKSAKAQENFSNFKNDKLKTKYPQGTFINDDTSKTSTNGAGSIRFGGGLFFDYKKWNSSAPTDLENNTISNYNFMSINNKRTNEDEILKNYNVMPNDIYAKRTIINPAHPTRTWHEGTDVGWWTESQKQAWDFSKSTNKNDNNKIMTNNDFNLTPNLIRSSSRYSNKNLFKQLFNEELYDWYWKIWYQDYDDTAIAEQNYDKAVQQDKALKDSQLLNSVKLDLSISWNQLISQSHELNIYEKMGKVALEIALKTLISAEFGPIIGEIGGSMLGFLLPDTYMTSQSIKNITDYLSQTINGSFWDALFKQYLGIPNGKTGLINTEYIPKYEADPTNISIKDFDFYIPFKSIKIKSDFTWNSSGGDAYGPDYINNFSSSSINLKDLNLKLGINFDMSRNDPSIQKILNQLSKLPKDAIQLGKSTLTTPYNATNPNNAKWITTHINTLSPVYKYIMYNLSYIGQLSLGQNNVEVFYKGVDQNFTIPVEVDQY